MREWVWRLACGFSESSMSAFSTILQVALLIFVVVLIFNLIIFVHELGHFLAGRWRGLQIDRFQIWFGKPIWKKEINGVQYGLGWIPAGGFVALPQMAPMEAIEGGDTDRAALPPISALDKIIVAIAGPIFSLLLALTAALVVWGVGKPKDFIPTTTIGYVLDNSPAEKAGILPGDEVLAINGEKVTGYMGSLDCIKERIVLSSGNEIEFTVKRPGVAEPLKLVSGFDIPESQFFQRRALRQVGLSAASKAVVGEVEAGSPAEKAGLSKGDLITSFDGATLYSPFQLAQYLKTKDQQKVTLGVVRKSGETTQAELTVLTPEMPKGLDPGIGIQWAYVNDADVRIVYPDPITLIKDTSRSLWTTISKVADPKSSIGVDHLSGPVGIGQMLYSLLQTEDGWRRILVFLVFFNVNLAVLNMLPFPVLDGGHITLALLEKIFGRPVKAKPLELIQTGCALALMSLMLYVTSKDISDNFRRDGSTTKAQKTVWPE